MGLEPCTPETKEREPTTAVGAGIKLFKRLEEGEDVGASSSAPPNQMIELVPVDRTEAVFEARGTSRKDSVIYRNGWAKEILFSSDTGDHPADLLDHLHGLTDDDLRGLTRDELMDLLAQFESDLTEPQLATVHDIITGYSTEEEDSDEDDQENEVQQAPLPPSKPRLLFEPTPMEPEDDAHSCTSPMHNVAL